MKKKYTLDALKKWFKPKTMKLTLTVEERIKIIDFLNSFKGSIAENVTMMEDVKKIMIGEEEAKEIELKNESKTEGEKTFTWTTWSKEKAQDKEIELSTVVIDFVKKQIEEKDAKKEFTAMDTAIFKLYDKIKGEKEEITPEIVE